MLKINKKLKLSKIKLSAYNNTRLEIEGEIDVKIKFKHATDNINFIVIKTDDKPILGLETCIKLKIINKLESIDSAKKVTQDAEKSMNKTNFKDKDEILLAYKEVFSGLGKFPGKPYSIQLKEDAIPVTYSPRRIPKRLQERLRETLDRLEKAKIITRSDGPREWQHPLVIIEKSDKSLRLCLDPKDLNEQILNDKYQIPTTEEIFDDLAHKNYFSILDLRESFYQIPICSQSAKLCAFGTPFGTYQFERLPFGIKISAEVFQKKNVEIFGSIKGIKIYIDDIIIAGSNKKEHDSILRKVLEKAREAKITFNKDKFQFCKSEIRILGHIVSKDGIAIDPRRIQAINEMPEPNNKKSLLRFLGVVKYVAKFCPNLSAETAPLRNLTRDGEPWSWTHTHSECINKIKNLLTNSTILAHYDENLSTTIQTDACNEGLGCVLLQNNKPISFASRSLTKAEQKYSIIEKEMLGVCFSLERFHYYVYGRTVEIQTDHKPLISIMKQDFDKVPTRLQRMRLKLMKYQFNISYLPGKHMILADALSRAYLPNKGEEDPEMEYIIHNIVKSVMSKKQQSKFAEATTHDLILSQVVSFIQNGWPTNKISGEIGKYFALKEFLSVNFDILFYGDRMVIPRSERKVLITKLHEGHLGISKTIAKARRLFYWPGMSAEIRDYILGCSVCQETRNKNTKEPMISVEIPLRPWAKLGMDIMEFRNKVYLVVIDYFSKWIEYEKIISKDSINVIRSTRKMFARFGFPSEIIADNNPFGSKLFRDYADQNGIKLTTSSPNYSQGHALAETGVKIVKTMLRKCERTGQDPSILILHYRNTASPDTHFSPSQLMLGRWLNDGLNFNESDLQIRPINSQIIESTIHKAKLRQKYYYDHGARNLPDVQKEDPIIYRHKNAWHNGTVLGEAQTPRSWIIKGENNKIYRRNRRHLIPIKSNNNTKRNNVAKEKTYYQDANYSLRDRTKIQAPKRMGMVNYKEGDF